MTRRLTVLPHEVSLTAIRAQGAGGQNVNKVSNAVHLRFDVHASSLPDAVKQRLLASGDARITQDGVVVIKAQSQRSLPQNRDEALARLQDMVDAASHEPRTRHATRPTLASKKRRLEGKRVRSGIKALRGRAGSHAD